MSRRVAATGFVLVALCALVAVSTVTGPSPLRAASPSPVVYLPLVSSCMTHTGTFPSPQTFHDEFNCPYSGWATGPYPSAQNPIATLDYLNGTFQILALNSGAVGYLIPDGLDANGYSGLRAGDFQASIQVWAASPNPQGTNGFYFGANWPTYNSDGTCAPASNYGFYDFEVGTVNGSASQFFLARFNYAANDSTCDPANGTWCTLYPVQPSCATAGTATSPSLLPGNGVNLIQVARSGDSFTLSANGQQLAQVTDASSPLPSPAQQSTYLGLVASPGLANFDARFDNFSFTAGATPTSATAKVRPTSIAGETRPPAIRRPR